MSNSQTWELDVGWLRVDRFQYFSKELESARISGLPQPEDCLLPNGGVLVLSSHVDQERHTFRFGELAQCEDRAFLHFGFRVLFYRLADDPHGLPAGFLTEPEDRFPADGR
jgi:hypothetical protein